MCKNPRQGAGGTRWQFWRRGRQVVIFAHGRCVLADRPASSKGASPGGDVRADRRLGQSVLFFLIRGPLMNCNAADSTLWNKIGDFEFDQGGPALTFARRLARENGWSTAHADRVLREYRRFAYLAIAAGHPVTPSPEVDQAWHLHLTYTRSYWHRFCRRTLGQPLHHEPTRGGGDEATKHGRQYVKTLESYERHFGERPPGDIWPEIEFTASNERWVDTSQYWLVPRPRLPKAWSTVAAAAILPVAAVWNPFDFDGRSFLVFYAVVALATLAVGLFLRYFTSDGSIEQEVPELSDPYEMAYLANGTPGVIQSALTALVRRGNLLLEHGRVSRGVPLPRIAPPIEQALVDTAPTKRDQTMSDFQYAAANVKPFIAEYRERLQAAGLIAPHPDEPFTNRWLPFLLMAGITALGIVKCVIGTNRDRPVAFLVVLTIACGLAAFLFLRQGRLTRQGKAAIDRLKKEHRPLTSGRVDAMSPLDAGLLVGLFGSTFLVGSELSTFHDMRRHWESSSSTGDGIAGCAVDHGGCGDGGGCGGGGCGGCSG